MSYNKNREDDESLIESDDYEPWLLEHVFRPKKREKYISLILYPLILACLTFVWYSVFFRQQHSDWILAAVIFLLIPAVLFVYSAISIFRGKLTVDTERITIVRGFSAKYLPLDKIAGFRVDKVIIIESIDPGMKNLHIPVSLEDIQLFVAWLRYTYPDLDRQDFGEQKEKMLGNPDYGYTEEQRLGHVLSVWRYTRILNISAVIIAGWSMVYPYPHQFLSAISIILPLMGLIMLAGSRGLIRLKTNKNDPHPTVFWALAAPPVPLFIHAVMDTNVINYDNLWVPAVVISVILFLILAKSGIDGIRFRQKLYYFLIYPIIAGAVFLYSASLILVVNTAFDTSQPKVIQAKVIKKSTHSAGYGSKAYSVDVGKLLPQQQEDDMDIIVSKGYYDGVNTGDVIDVYIQNGVLNILWVRLEKGYRFHSLFGFI